MSKFKLNFFLWLCAGVFFSAALHASTQAPVNKIKAAFIYQFTQFVRWPTSANSNDEFNICVYGKGPVEEALSDLGVRRELGVRIVINFPQKIQDINECKIVYIEKSGSKQSADILNYLKNKPILTVSSLSGFASSGGVIGFVTINGKVRMEINRTPAQHNNIEINAKLLEVASLVLNSDTEGESP